MVEITFEQMKKVVVHGFQEYTFDDLMQEFVSSEQAGGNVSDVLVWADGVVIQGSWYPIDRPPASKDYFEGGIMHMQSVTFAVKEKFEKQVIKGNMTVNFLDESEIEVYRDLAKKLKEQSKYKTSSQ